MALDLSLVGKSGPASTLAYTWKDAALYALGIGAKKDELDYLYEGRGPKMFPSFAVVPTFAPMLERVAETGGNMAMVVHGAQKVKVHKPFAPAATLHTTAKIRGIYDMRRFASVLLDTETKNDSGDLIATTVWTIIFRGEGGFGGDPPPKEPSGIDIPKEKQPDFAIEEKTTPEQALLYRLSGDPNPLHADPEFAKNVGFEQGPILHGLCTYGFMVRHAAKGACAGDATKITGIEAQFRKPVWPGDTLVTEGWIVAPGKVALRLSVKERNEAVLSNASICFSA
ncbi:MAG: MaoC/PaaZ C-terminal domain-containing protein [Polyangiaceae bacterium]